MNEHVQDVDLQLCRDEPIHIPGSVQPHGALLGLDDDWRVTHTGGSISTYFSRTWILGRRLSEIVPAETIGELEAVPLWSKSPGRNPWVRTELITESGRMTAEVSLHRNDQGVLVIEIEGAADSGGVKEGHDSDDLLAQVVNANTESAALDAAVRAIRDLTGYQRVVAYVFDRDFNGTIVSETLEPGLVSYLNQRFPASDIPEQARALYKRKRVRMISDVDYTPAPIEIMPGGVDPLDLSDSEIRSVSPIHVEYLQNMGVRATMVCSLQRDQDLIGMIACHQLEPKRVPPSVRSRAALISDVAAARVATLRDTARNEQILAAHQENADLLAALANEPESPDLLGKHVGRIQRMIDATGAAVIVGDRVFAAGRVPPDRDIRRIAKIVTQNGQSPVASTDELTSPAPDGAQLRDVAAGVLAVMLSDDGQDAVMWFRPEIVNSVHWAGNPSKAVTSDERGLRLAPRKSFDTYMELIRDKSMPWLDWELEVANSVRGSVTNIARQIRQLSALARERRAAELAAQEHAREIEIANTDLTEARAQAEAASRAKTDFVADVSHEIRTPLSAIIGYAELIAERNGLGAENAESLSVVRGASEHILSLVEDLLDLSKIEAGKLTLRDEAVDVAETIDVAVAMVRGHRDTNGSELAIDVAPELAEPVRLDGVRLRQILVNLIANALKFAAEGTVSVQACVVNHGGEERVRIAVADSGPGLDEASRRVIFERFEQPLPPAAEGRHRGFGLGLSICSRLATLMGGHTALERSAPGEGSVFVVELPLRRVAAGERAAAEPKPNAQSGGEAGGGSGTVALGGRVLIAEDAFHNQRLLKIYLERAGVSSIEAVRSGKQALDAVDAATERGEPFDLLLTDMQMPEMDGYELARAIRGRGMQLPIVAITAYAMSGERDRCMEAGCNDFITKPVRRDELLRIAAKHLRTSADAAASGA